MTIRYFTIEKLKSSTKESCGGLFQDGLDSNKYTWPEEGDLIRKVPNLYISCGSFPKSMGNWDSQCSMGREKPASRKNPSKTPGRKNGCDTCVVQVCACIRMYIVVRVHRSDSSFYALPVLPISLLGASSVSLTPVVWISKGWAGGWVGATRFRQGQWINRNHRHLVLIQLNRFANSFEHLLMLIVVMCACVHMSAFSTCISEYLCH
jgi:hypothetical protein